MKIRKDGTYRIETPRGGIYFERTVTNRDGAGWSVSYPAGRLERLGCLMLHEVIDVLTRDAKERYGCCSEVSRLSATGDWEPYRPG